jgi:parallel beta-helix repeat protein
MTARRAGLAFAATLLAGMGLLMIAGVAVFQQRHGPPLRAPSFTPPIEAQPPPCPEAIQALVDRASPGSTVIVGPCLARETITIDRPLTLRGEAGAAIRGSDPWTSWTQSGTVWRSEEVVPVFERNGFCADGDECLDPEQVFRDGVPLKRAVGTPGPDTFGLDAGRHVLLGVDPHRHLIEVTTRTTWVLIDAPDVTVEGFDMRHAANAPQTGAILNVSGAGQDTISGNTVAYAHGAGIALDHGSGNAILNNDVGFSGQLGIHLGGGGSAENGRNNVVRGNVVHHNNQALFDPEWEAGGLKATVQTHLVVEDNQFESNAGPGIWCDIYCSDVTIARNRVHDNTHAGIMYEVSSDASIVSNVVWNNGSGKPQWGWGAGILISSSGSVDISDNTSAWNQQAAISIISQHRTDWPGVDTTDIRVHGNTMAQRAGWLAFWAQDWDGKLFDGASANEGFHNSYWPDDGSRPAQFHWGRDIDNLPEFEATPGEEDATLLDKADLMARLRAVDVPAPP